MALPLTKFCSKCKKTIRAHSLCGGTTRYVHTGGIGMHCCTYGQEVGDHGDNCPNRQVKYADI